MHHPRYLVLLFSLFVICEKCSCQADSLRSVYDLDHGEWLSLKTGIQTNDVPIGQRWTVSMFYETRSRGNISFVAEMHVWRDHLTAQQSSNVTDSYSTQWTINPSIKTRFNISHFSLGFQAGLGITFTSFFYLQYGSSIEYFLTDQYAISLSQKRYSAEEIDHFIFVGILRSL